MKLFAGENFRDFTDKKLESITSEINTKTEDYLLKVSKDELGAYLKSKNEIDVPTLHFENRSVTSIERDLAR